MESIPQPKTIKVYQLIKMSSLSFVPIGMPASNSMGAGFFTTLQEAEHNRSLEILKDSTTGSIKPSWHIFELEFPNPALRE